MKSLDHFTVDYLLSHTQEEGDCLIWTGSAQHGKYPQVRIGDSRTGAAIAVRRIIYEKVHGELMPGKQVGTKCKTLLCVHPDCLVQRTKSQAHKGQKLRPDHIMRIIAGKRAKAKLNMETVREIRASDELCTALDARHGLSDGYASRIRTNRVWVDHSSPFAGLGARP
jgi:hypothetical protein